MIPIEDFTDVILMTPMTLMKLSGDDSSGARVHSPKISTSSKKNSTDISARSAAFCISGVVSVKSSIGIITHQSHISKVNANA